MAHTAGAYPGFRSIKRLGVLLLPLDGMLVHRRISPPPSPLPSSKFAGNHLYTWVERGTVRVKCLAQKHNAAPRPHLEPGPLDSESSALTIRPPHARYTLSQEHRQNSRNFMDTLHFLFSSYMTSKGKVSANSTWVNVSHDWSWEQYDNGHEQCPYP